MTAEQLAELRAKALRTLHEIATDERQPDEARVLAAAAFLQHARPPAPPAPHAHHCDNCTE